MQKKAPQKIGLLGGMFNPVHNGHLRIAIECKETFLLDELRMLPCAEPPHRAMPKTSPQQRLDMLNLAVKEIDGIQSDGREIDRVGPSYTVDTLRSLKAENPKSHLFLIIGSDAFQRLDTWFQWEEILALSNIIIAQRPGNQDNFLSEVGKKLKKNFSQEIETFVASPYGRIFAFKASQLEISSSAVRQLFREKKSAQCLLPETVLEYIKQNKIY